jgi:hypothetical protein
MLFKYKVPWFETLDFECVLTLQVPGIETQVVTDSERKNSGQIYRITMKPYIRGLLVTPPTNAPIIKWIMYRVYDNLNEVKYMGGVQINSVPNLLPIEGA